MSIDFARGYEQGTTDGKEVARKRIALHVRRRLVDFSGDTSVTLAVRGELAQLAAEIERGEYER